MVRQQHDINLHLNRWTCAGRRALIPLDVFQECFYDVLGYQLAFLPNKYFKALYALGLRKFCGLSIRKSSNVMCCEIDTLDFYLLASRSYRLTYRKEYNVQFVEDWARLCDWVKLFRRAKTNAERKKKYNDKKARQRKIQKKYNDKRYAAKKVKGDGTQPL